MSRLFSASQQRGLLVLAILIGAFLCLRWWQLSKGGTSLPNLPVSGQVTRHDEHRLGPKSVPVNSADSAAFEALPGIGPKLSARIVKYRTSRGGCFTDLNQISQVYGLKDSTYQLILPFLYLDPCTPVTPPKTSWEKKKTTEFTPKVKEQIRPVDLNTADSATLESLPGIGAKLAGRIIKFRNALGYYHHLDQLSEVYGFSDSLRMKAIPYLFIGNDLAGYPHLKVNSAPAEELGRHPYLGAKTAGTLVKYRSKIGRFHSIADLRKVYGLDSNRVRKLEPYILLE